MRGDSYMIYIYIYIFERLPKGLMGVKPCGDLNLPKEAA